MNNLQTSHQFHDQAEAFFAPVVEAILMLRDSFDRATGTISTLDQDSQKNLRSIYMRDALNAIRYKTEKTSDAMNYASLNFQQPGSIIKTPPLRFEEKHSLRVNNQNRDLFLAAVVTKMIQVQTVLDPKAGNGFRLAQEYGEAIRQILDTKKSGHTYVTLDPSP